MKNLRNLIVILGLIVLSACSDSDEKIIEEFEDKELSEVMDSFQTKVSEIEIPTALSNNSDSNAQTTATYFNVVKSYGLIFSAFFNVPENATSQRLNLAGRNSATGNTQTYTWSDGTSTINYTVTELVDRFTFAYEIQSPNYSGKVMDGYSLKDESRAELNMYDSSTGGSVLSLKWTFINNTATLDVKSSDGSQFILTANPDNSGNLEIYENNSLSVKCTWTATGNGTLINYETGETFTW